MLNAPSPPTTKSAAGRAETGEPAADEPVCLLCTRRIKAFLQPHGLRISSSAHNHLDAFLRSLLACLAQVQKQTAGATGNQSSWSTLLVVGEEVLPEIVPWLREWQDRLLAAPVATDHQMGQRGLVELSMDQLAAASGLHLSPTPCQALVCALDDLVAWVLSAAMRLIRAGGAIKRSTIRRADVKAILEKGPMFRKLAHRLVGIGPAADDELWAKRPDHHDETENERPPTPDPSAPLPGGTDPCVTTSIETTTDSIPSQPTTDHVPAASSSLEHIRKLEEEIAVLRGIIARLAQL